MSPQSTLATWLSLLGLATGHGGGISYTIDGVEHLGNYDRLKNTRSIQREWNWNSAEELDDPWMACGPPGALAKESYHALHTAGSVISVNYTVPGSTNDMDVWRGMPVRPWTFGHYQGPMTAYLAPCPDSGCESIDVNAPVWVKFWEAGLRSGNWIDGDWAMADVYYGANLDVPTPKTLKPGKYLMRHEMNNIINGAQWFANCIQLDVIGEGTASLPTEVGMAVSFGNGPKDPRDAYAKDEGLNGSFCKTTKGCGGSSWFFGAAGKQTTYHIPGPPVWQG